MVVNLGEEAGLVVLSAVGMGGGWGVLKVASVQVSGREDFLEVLSLGKMVERNCFDGHHLPIDLGIVLKFAVLANIWINFIILSNISLLLILPTELLNLCTFVILLIIHIVSVENPTSLTIMVIYIIHLLLSALYNSHFHIICSLIEIL